MLYFTLFLYIPFMIYELLDPINTSIYDQV